MYQLKQKYKTKHFMEAIYYGHKQVVDKLKW